MSCTLLQAIRTRHSAMLERVCITVSVCVGSPCMASGAVDILDVLKNAYGGRVSIRVIGTGCIGPCGRGPLIRISGPEAACVCERMTPGSALEAVEAFLSAYGDVPGALPDRFPFIAGQTRIVLANCGTIDPESLEDAVSSGAYSALSDIMERMPPDSVIDEIERSGLRGRGGGGYLTGLKWRQVASAPGDRKIVIANGDEGDPGAFMDRTLMESDPHRIIEGMSIAAYAVGAEEGYLYVRCEYPVAAGRLKKAVKDAEAAGVTGGSLLGKGPPFSLSVRMGAGAFVCGEETALMASVRGRRGQPVIRPPYPAEHGLWGCPTLINNVETFGCIAPLISMGADRFRAIGTEGNSGTKVFAVSGDVAAVGVIEVPLGTTLRTILFDIAGGMNGQAFKAAQTGGAGGGCIPAACLDVPMEYESLKELGTMIGSGGLIVMGESVCMVDVASYFISFSCEESCGICTPCRSGTAQLSLLLQRIRNGRGDQDTVARIEELCGVIRESSLCGLGVGAPGPVLSMLRWFRDEFEAHCRDRICRAGICPMGER